MSGFVVLFYWVMKILDVVFKGCVFDVIIIDGIDIVVLVKWVVD